MSEDLKQDELETLKARADQMGIKYHPSIGVASLKEKIQEALDAAKADNETTTEKGSDKTPANETANARRLRKKREAEQLVRVMVTNMNPHKKDWEGEIFTAGNNIVPTIRKFVPYGVEWHVPRIILNMIKERKCQVFVTRKDGKGGTIREGKLIPEFNVAELPPLTEKELKELAQRQAMANGTTE